MRVTILGPPYGAHNVGDEVILESIVQFLRGELALEIAAVVQDPYTCSRLGIRNLPFAWCGRPRLGMWWRSLKNPILGLRNRCLVLQHVADLEALVVGGATILSDCPWHALRYVFLAKAMKKPTAIFGVGMCPVEDDSTRNFVVRGVCLADAVWVRDEKVKERLVAYGVPEGHLKVGGDPAFAIEGGSWDEVEETLGADFSRFFAGDAVVAVCFSGEYDVYKKYNFEQLVMSTELLIKKGFKILYLPSNTRKGMDIEIGYKISDALPPHYRCRYLLIRKELLPRQIVALGHKLAAVWTSWLHVLILLSLSGVPWLALARNEKLLDFASLFSVPAISNVADIKPSSVADCTANVAIDRNIRERVHNQAEKRRNLVLAAGQELRE